MPAHKTVYHPFEVVEAPALGSGREDSPAPRPAGSSVFLVVAQLIERKGIFQLFQAAKLLADRGLNDFTIQIAGTGELAETLRRQAASSGLNGQVQWLGRVSYEELAQYYQACDALVLPSLEDTWGMVVLGACPRIQLNSIRA